MSRTACAGALVLALALPPALRAAGNPAGAAQGLTAEQALRRLMEVTLLPQR